MIVSISVFLIGVHQVTVARWETGGKTPLPIVQRALADLDARRSRVQAQAGQGDSDSTTLNIK